MPLKTGKSRKILLAFSKASKSKKSKKKIVKPVKPAKMDKETMMKKEEIMEYAKDHNARKKAMGM